MRVWHVANINLNKSDMDWIKKIFSKKHDKQCAINVVSNSVCPNCGAKGHRTTLTNNSYACKKCKTWWANGC